ncbi:hypothetical protein [Serratia grimesii]|uniref:hypothetical protein n=1 Tax=Serratia grimesii TaxID=82995 RepID=UPI00223EEDFE|nr:hypothetical protein [Serratia grimesii]
MFHLDNTSGVPEMPAVKEPQSNTPRWFGESVDQGGISWPGADWFNIVQAELLAILALAGETPSKEKHDQIADAISKLSNKLSLDLGKIDGFRHIGRCPDYINLRQIEPDASYQIINVIGFIGDTAQGGGYFWYDPTDTTSLDDGGITLVTPDGHRWKRIFDGMSVNIAWFKTSDNTWDDAWEGCIKYGNFGVADFRTQRTRKIMLPAGVTGPMRRPIAFPKDYGWYIEGTGGLGASGTRAGSTLLFDIRPEDGYGDDAGAIEHFPDSWVGTLSLRNLTISGQAAPTGFSYAHPLVARPGNCAWYDVEIRNFRGGVKLDNAFDCAFYRFSVFACGRSTGDYMNIADISDSSKTTTSALEVYSTRAGDSSNFLRFYDGSFELNNCSPMVRVKSGTQIHFIHSHTERIGRGSMWSPAPPGQLIGTFMEIGSAEVWLDGVGANPSFEYFLDLKGYSQVILSNIQRGGAATKFSGSGADGRIKASNCILGRLELPMSFGGDCNFVNCTFTKVTVGGATGLRSFVECTVLGDLTGVHSTNVVGSSAGVHVNGGRIDGNLTADTFAQKWKIRGVTIFGNLTYNGANGVIADNHVSGTESVLTTGTNLWRPSALTKSETRAASLSGIYGTFKVGSVIWNSNPVPGGFMGWVCTTAGLGNSTAVFKTFGVVTS